MPLNIAPSYSESTKSELEKATKIMIYSGVVGGLASVLVGGETFSESTAILGMPIPNPIVVGGAVGLSAGSAELLTYYVTPSLFGDTQMLGLENTLVKTGISVAAGVTSLAYVGIPPSVNSVLLGLGSHVSGSYIMTNLDSSMLGMLF